MKTLKNIFYVFLTHFFPLILVDFLWIIWNLFLLSEIVNVRYASSGRTWIEDV